MKKILRVLLLDPFPELGIQARTGAAKLREWRDLVEAATPGKDGSQRGRRKSFFELILKKQELTPSDFLMIKRKFEVDGFVLMPAVIVSGV